MNKLTRIAITVAFAASAIGTANAAAHNNNPLHPSYFANKSGMVASETLVAPAARYVAKNPLHPTYSKVTGDSWIATKAESGTVPYRDARNPLYPQFRRS
jgi:uncharacterized protein (UPF0305 family)